MINIVELDERINKCLSILQDNPRSRIFAALAEAYRRRGEVGRAFSICKNGLRLHPDYGAAHVVMAKLFLHQNMADQALVSIERAIELDGESRSTDLVLADIYLETGDYQNVRKLLVNLDRLGGADPAVETIRRRLSQLIRGPQAKSSSTTSSASQAGQLSIPSEPAAAVVCRDPVEAVNLVVQVPQAVISAIWNDDGTQLAARGGAEQQTRAVTDEAWEMFKNIDQHLAAHGWGRLSRMRIEEPQGHWGMHKHEGMIALFLGTPRMRYAAAARRIAECLDQLAGYNSMQDGDRSIQPAVTEGSPD